MRIHRVYLVFLAAGLLLVPGSHTLLTLAAALLFGFWMACMVFNKEYFP